MVGAAARYFHLGPRPLRGGIEAVMVMVVPQQGCGRPTQGRQVHHIHGLGAALHHDIATLAPAQTGDFVPAAARGASELDQHFLALALHNRIDPQFAKRRAGCCRAVRADRDGNSSDADKRLQGCLRHPQFGRRAAPEQITRRRGDDDHVGRESRDLRRQCRVVYRPQLSVEDLGAVASIGQQSARVTVFERKMRLSAAEIDAAGEFPGRVDQRDPHCAATRIGAVSMRAASSQACRRLTPSSALTRGCQPVIRVNLAWFDTYQR